MRTTLLASTALLAIAVPAHAEDITTKRTTPVQTSTVKNNTPDSITITSTGSVVVSSGTAVTMDSDHKVVNQGAVTIGNASNATGILAVSGTTGEINNSGTIPIDEPYTPTDTDNDGDLDGPFALGSNRFGIRTDGTHAGAITNTGTITVEGNDSAGIWLGGAQTGKVRLTEKMVIERYSHVMHIVSNVVGELSEDHDALSAFLAGMPAGTVSGAPKVRAMEIIDELEPEKRGVYGGGVGYFSAMGDMDMCIALRTAVLKDRKLYIQSGGGVVYDSDPEAEFQETVNKSKAIARAAAEAGLFTRGGNS